MGMDEKYNGLGNYQEGMTEDMVYNMPEEDDNVV